LKKGGVARYEGQEEEREETSQVWNPSGGIERGLRFILSTSLSRRAYFWARSLFLSANLEITTEKWRLMKIRNKKAQRKMVEEGVTAPTRWVIHFKRSNHKVRRRMTEAVISHNQEYSSRRLLLRTRSIIRINIPTPKIRATNLFRIGMNTSLKFSPPSSLTRLFTKSDRNVPRAALGGIGGVKGHNRNDNTLPGSPALGGKLRSSRLCVRRLRLHGDLKGLDDFCGVSGHPGVFRNILRHDRTWSDKGTFPDLDSRQNDGTDSKKSPFSDLHLFHFLFPYDLSKDWGGIKMGNDLDFPGQPGILLDFNLLGMNRVDEYMVGNVDPPDILDSNTPEPMDEGSQKRRKGNVISDHSQKGFVEMGK
jgi:hypothetical protein